MSIKMSTEDLGITTEYALCLLYNQQFPRQFKYSTEKANTLQIRFQNLKTHFPSLEYVGHKSNLYDFENPKLSVKTTKRYWKFCPQQIGQATIKKFKSIFCLQDEDNIRKFILENPSTLLERYFEHSFHCPIFWYNETQNKCLLIRLKKQIEWDKYEITFTKPSVNIWRESNTLKITRYTYNLKDGLQIITATVGEFQIHKNRNCIKFRFCFSGLLKLFDTHFDIIEI